MAFPLWLPAAALALQTQLSPADPSSQAEVHRAETLVVTAVASRVAEAVDATPATVTVIRRQDLDRNLARDVRDALRYEPGISIENAPARFGLGNINIRGLDGNRVQMLEDGIRLPDAYKVGSFSNASRNPFDVAMLSRIEVLRGPGSALYGSDALAGVVSMTTLDPPDLLGGEARAGAIADTGWASADRSIHRDAIIAGRIGAAELLVGASAADGKAFDNRGMNDVVGNLRTRPNPQDTHGTAQLAKAVLPTSYGRWRAAYERYDRRVLTDVLSLNPQSAKTVSLFGDDGARRERYSVDGEFFGVGAIERLAIVVYRQQSSTRQDTDEVRANTTAQCLSASGNVSCRREARFTFAEDEVGVSAIGQGRIGTRQSLVFGAEWSRAKVEEMRDGRQTNLVTGAVTNVVGTDILPTRDFPDSTVERIGAFAQDEIAIGAASVIPALRYDRLSTEPHPDAAYTASNPGRTPVAIADSRWSPKLGAIVPIARQLAVTLQAAAGFRAPSYADVNIGLSNLPLGYTVIPNPDLRPEKSAGLEAGVRGRHAGLDWSVVAYRTDYRDLIVSRAPLVCPGDPHCVAGATITFQSRNVTRARIEGVELRGEARISAGWVARGGAAWSRGDDRSRGVPLNSVDPAKAVAGLAWDPPGRGFGGEAHVAHAWRKHRIDASAGPLYATPSYTTVDLTAYAKVARHATLRAGVFNLLDEKYWLWSDVRSVPNPGATIDRYTQPGRNYALQVKLDF
jgi:hemoglobin/transferrin/lactoferrin receptor protein